jgi:asparagine synthase (glutamine-hydrolysing)
VTALPAGHRATVTTEAFTRERYWTPPVDQLVTGREAAVGDLEALLQDSIRCHMISDRPLGVFLSGGLDSSLVAALAVTANANVQTVSVDFEERGFSEHSHARRVARHIGSRHTVLALTAGQLRAWLDDAFEAMDQPSFDGINTYAVSRAAAEAGLKVALSGLGADELFDGYGYVRRLRMLERARSLPGPVRRGAGTFAPLVPGSRGEKAAAWLREPGQPEVGYRLLRELFPPADLNRLLGHPPAAQQRTGANGGATTDAEIARRLPLLDIDNYLRNVLLRDTDAMSMGNGLEVRVPYLDDRVVDWALRLPPALKGERKQLLRAVARDLLPAEILARPKRGFLLPLDRWIASELRPQVERALRDPPDAVRAVVLKDRLPLVLDAHRTRRSHWLRPWALYSLCRWAGTLSSHPRQRDLCHSTPRS